VISRYPDPAEPPEDRIRQLTFCSELVLSLACQEASYMHRPQIGTEHMLIGLLREHYSIASQVLSDFALTTSQVRAEAVELYETSLI
jgi:ATP-dependent Clp protease ATP-binding subunit ClpA